MKNNAIINNIENTTGIATMKKIDWYKADRMLSGHVADYMKKFVWKAELTEKFRQEAEEIENGIAATERLKGSILEDKIPEMKATFMVRLAELERQRKEQIALEATYTLSDADKALRKAFTKYAKDGSADPVDALVKWFAVHGMPIDENNAIIKEIFEAAGESLHVKHLVRTEGNVATGFNAGNAFKMVFAKCYEHMVYVGTIKPVQIPELIRAKYAPKQKKNNKGEKKA